MFICLWISGLFSQIPYLTRNMILWHTMTSFSSFTASCFTLKVTTPLKSLGMTWYSVVTTDFTSPNLWANYATNFCGEKTMPPLEPLPVTWGGRCFCCSQYVCWVAARYTLPPLSVRFTLGCRSCTTGKVFFWGVSRKLIFFVVKINYRQKTTFAGWWFTERLWSNGTFFSFSYCVDLF